MAANKIYARWHLWLQKFETKTRLPEDAPISDCEAQVIVLGMGRVGTEVYDIMKGKYKHKVLGIDFNREKVKKHCALGRNVVNGDATDSDFWERIQLSPDVQLIILSASNHHTHMEVISELKYYKIGKMIAALTLYEDEISELKEAGVDIVFNLYAEAGAGYAEHVYQLSRQRC
jgi:Trk K+ transport system NAD-binding subunit